MITKNHPTAHGCSSPTPNSPIPDRASANSLLHRLLHRYDISDVTNTSYGNIYISDVPDTSHDNYNYISDVINTTYTTTNRL